jgi:hypothetical protein
MSPRISSRSRSAQTAIGAARQITVTQEGRMVAFATVTTNDNHELFANIHIESGHVPMQTRPALLDALMSVAGTDGARRLNLVVPMGDCLIEDLHQCCEVRTTRPAGATCLIGAVPPTSAAPLATHRSAATAGRPLDVAVSLLM